MASPLTSAVAVPEFLRMPGRDTDNTNLQLGPPTVRADNWGDALRTMLGGALGVTGPLGGAGIIASLVGSDMLGQRPSISPTQVIGRAMADDKPKPSDRDVTAELLATENFSAPGYSIGRREVMAKPDYDRGDKVDKGKGKGKF